MKKRIIVLGSSGLLGTSLETIFKKEKDFDYSGFTHTDLEITNTKEVNYLINQVKPEIIINTVALIGINTCEMDPYKTMSINAFSVFELAKICKEKKIVLAQSSSHAVFDGKNNSSYYENDKPNPINIYGYSKLISEYFIKMNLSDYYIFRFPTMYGPRKNKALGFVCKMIIRMKEGEDLKVAEDRMDSPSYSKNIAKKIKDILSNKLKYGIYHLSDKGRISYYDFIFQLAKEINFSGKIFKAKDSDFKALAPNPLKVALDSKYSSTNISWKDSIKMYVKDEGITC